MSSFIKDINTLGIDVVAEFLRRYDYEALNKYADHIVENGIDWNYELAEKRPWKRDKQNTPESRFVWFSYVQYAATNDGATMPLTIEESLLYWLSDMIYLSWRDHPDVRVLSEDEYDKEYRTPYGQDEINPVDKTTGNGASRRYGDVFIDHKRGKDWYSWKRGEYDKKGPYSSWKAALAAQNVPVDPSLRVSPIWRKQFKIAHKL